MGPYEYKGSPLEDSYNIDGSYITIKGQLYLMYSQWNGDYQQLFIVEMSDPWTASGSPSLLSSPSLDWEQVGMNVNEGPEPLIYNGHVYVVYSASYCATSSYKLGLLELTGDDPLSIDSWTKTSEPVFESANGVYAPGHNGFLLHQMAKKIGLFITLMLALATVVAQHVHFVHNHLLGIVTVRQTSVSLLLLEPRSLCLPVKMAQ